METLLERSEFQNVSLAFPWKDILIEPELLAEDIVKAYRAKKVLSQLEKKGSHTNR